MRVFHLLFLIIISSSLIGQTIKYTIPQTKEVTINSNDSILIINVYSFNKKIKVLNDLMYYWYYDNSIHKNMGDYQGVLLNGSYSLFNKDYTLLLKGEFTKGVKNGVWKRWYDNGEMKEVHYWTEGRREEKSIFYSKEKKVVKEISYKDGMLHGLYIEYNDTATIEKKYKKGKEKVRRKKIYRKKKTKKEKKEDEIKVKRKTIKEEDKIKDLSSNEAEKEKTRKSIFKKTEKEEVNQQKEPNKENQKPTTKKEKVDKPKKEKKTKINATKISKDKVDDK